MVGGNSGGDFHYTDQGLAGQNMTDNEMDAASPTMPYRNIAEIDSPSI